MTIFDDVVATGRKLAHGASKIGSKVIGAVKTGVKIGDRALNALGTGVEVISGLPIVGGMVKPFVEPVKAGIEAGKKVLDVGKRVVDVGEKAVTALGNV